MLTQDERTHLIRRRAELDHRDDPRAVARYRDVVEELQHLRGYGESSRATAAAKAGGGEG